MKFDPDKQIMVESDISNYVTKRVFSQLISTNTLRPVACFSKKHTSAKCNYKIYDKELIAII